jgi:hypothetical protein
MREGDIVLKSSTCAVEVVISSVHGVYIETRPIGGHKVQRVHGHTIWCRCGCQDISAPCGYGNRALESTIASAGATAACPDIRFAGDVSHFKDSPALACPVTLKIRLDEVGKLCQHNAGVGTCHRLRLVLSIEFGERKVGSRCQTG